MIRELFLGGGGRNENSIFLEVREKWSFSADFETRQKLPRQDYLHLEKFLRKSWRHCVLCSRCRCTQVYVAQACQKCLFASLSRCVLSSFRIRNFCCISSSGLHLLDFQLQDVQLSVAVHGKCTGLLVGSMKFLILHFLLGL